MSNDSLEQEALLLKTWTGFRRIFIRDIIFVECDIQGVRFVIKNDSIECPESLKTVLMLLKRNGFCSIHRKYIVNLLYVEKYNKDKHKLKVIKDD